MAKQKTESLILVPTEEQPYIIPANWRWIFLENIADIIMGQSPLGTATTDDSSYIPLIGGASDMGLLYPEAKRYTMIPTKTSKPGDIILCIRATLGQPIYADGKYCLGRGVAGIRPLIGSKEYYRYMFINFEQYLYDNATGSTFAQVSSNVLKKMPVPVAPISEQTRIVEYIEKIFAQLDEAEEKAQAVVDGFSTRKRAILHQVFTGELTESWRRDHRGQHFRRIVTIKEICSSLSYGTSSKSSKEGKMAVIRMGNIQEGEIDWTDLVYSNNELDNQKYSLSPGDILFNRTNSAEHVGKTAIYRGEKPAIYAGYLIKIDYDHSIIIGEYLNYLLNSPEAKEYCNRVKTDAVNQSNINAQKIGAFKIPLISIDEQTESCRLARKMIEAEKAVRNSAVEAIETIHSMKKAVLAKAFQGRLGTNDPNESPVQLS